MKKVIETVSGHIGSGKSRSFHQWYQERISDNGGDPIPATVATPTNKLSTQHHGYFQDEGIHSVVISQEEGYRSSSEEYARRCNEGYPGVLLANHMVALRSSASTADRMLIVDESFSPLNTIYIEFKSPEDVQEFAVMPTVEPGYYELISSEHAIGLALDVKDKDGTNYRSYGDKARELGEYILNQHFRVVIDRESFDDAASGKAFEANVDGKTPRVFLQFTIFMLHTISDRYLNMLLICANVEKTLLARMWKRHVSFATNHSIQDRLDYSDLSHKAKQTKIYYPPVSNLSKTFLKRLAGGNEEAGQQAFLNLVADAIGTLFPQKRHIYCTNKHSNPNKEYRWKLEGKGGERVITNPHGWNDLQDCNMAVFMAAINYDPETVRRLSDFYDISPKEAKEALAYELVYQFLGRTSLRDMNSNEEVILVAPDQGAAEFIQQIIGCEAPIPLPVQFGVEVKKRGPAKTVFRTEAEEREYQRQKQANWRAKKKAEAAAQLSI